MIGLNIPRKIIPPLFCSFIAERLNPSTSDTWLGRKVTALVRRWPFCSYAKLMDARSVIRQQSELIEHLQEDYERLVPRVPSPQFRAVRTEHRDESMEYVCTSRFEFEPFLMTEAVPREVLRDGELSAYTEALLHHMAKHAANWHVNKNLIPIMVDQMKGVRK